MLSKMLWSPEIIFPNWLSSIAENLGLPWQKLAFIATGSYTLRLILWILIAGIISLTVIRETERFELLKPTLQMR